MKAKILHADHTLQKEGVPLAQRAKHSLCRWMAPVAAAAALIAGALPAEAAKPHDKAQPQIISQQQTQKEVFLFGEIHGHKPSSNYMQEYLPELKKAGYNTLALELPHSIEKEFLELLDKPAKNTPLSQKNGFSGVVPKETIQVAQKAKSLGMEVRCIDGELSKSHIKAAEKADNRLANQKITEKEYVKELEKCFAQRNQVMKKHLQQIPGKTIALVGAFHTGGPTGLDTLLKKAGIPTKTLDLMPTGHPGVIDLFNKYQEPADLVIKNPEKGVKREHLTLLEELDIDALQAIMDKAATQNTPQKKERKKEALLAQHPSL
jgi:uncharacterized protein YbaP (TraB family)